MPGTQSVTTVFSRDHIDSPANEYQCDGIDDDVQIQAAIDALPSSGGKVVLSEGTFTIATAISIPSHVTVEGKEYSTIVKVANSKNISAFINSDTTNGNTNITLRDFKIDGNRANQSSPANGGIYFTSATRSTNISFLNLWIVDCEGHGLHPKDTDYLRVHNVFLDGNGVTGNSAYHNAYFFHSDYASITGLVTVNSIAGRGCKLTDMSWGTAEIIAAGNSDTGVSISDACSQMLCLIVAYNNGANGIRVVSENSNVPVECVIHGICEANTNHGLHLAGNQMIVSGHYSGSSGSSQDGIRITTAGDKNLIQSVRARDNTGTGITLDSGADNNVIANCNFDNNTGDGIADNGAGNIIRQNAGWVTENSGTATITNGNTSVTVTHGLDVTPTIDDISVLMGESPTNDPGNIWVDTITSTQFNINSRNDPGASNLDFGWKAVVL